MSANTILTSIVTGGSNNHTTTAEEANAVRTDFGTAGVIGVITLNSGSGGTGSYCVNQNTGSNLAINILAGTAQFFITPSSQGSQMLRPIAAADYTAYTINSNASGSTKYDWIYLSGNATNANNPSSTSDNVVSIVTSRSSSNTVDNGSAPTYGLLLAVVTVANAATAITNSNISDKRANASLAGSGGSIVVTQVGTGNPAIVQASGSDTNILLALRGKGTSGVGLQLRTQSDNANTIASSTTNEVKMQVGWGQVLGTGASTLTDAVTFPTAFTTPVMVIVNWLGFKSGGTAVADITGFNSAISAGNIVQPLNISTSGFTMSATSSSTFGAAYHGYSWIAFGI